jgi:hypothetical protein
MCQGDSTEDEANEMRCAMCDVCAALSGDKMVTGIGGEPLCADVATVSSWKWRTVMGRWKFWSRMGVAGRKPQGVESYLFTRGKECVDTLISEVGGWWSGQWSPDDERLWPDFLGVARAFSNAVRPGLWTRVRGRVRALSAKPTIYLHPPIHLPTKRTRRNNRGEGLHYCTTGLVYLDPHVLFQPRVQILFGQVTIKGRPYGSLVMH